MVHHRGDARHWSIPGLAALQANMGVEPVNRFLIGLALDKTRLKGLESSASFGDKDNSFVMWIAGSIVEAKSHAFR